jgi:hypothetical protein
MANCAKCNVTSFKCEECGKEFCAICENGGKVNCPHCGAIHVESTHLVFGIYTPSKS